MKAMKPNRLRRRKAPLSDQLQHLPNSSIIVSRSQRGLLPRRGMMFFAFRPERQKYSILSILFILSDLFSGFLFGQDLQDLQDSLFISFRMKAMKPNPAFSEKKTPP
jgi:hypothetical protein